MDAGRFDTFTSTLARARSRRHALGGLLSGALSLLGSRAEHVAAKKKKACPPCKKRKKGKCKATLTDGTACSGGTCQGGRCVPSAPPPPPDPVTTADAACPSNHINWSGWQRNAQTFRALRSGQLTSASVALHHNVEGAAFDLEIWSVDGANAPSTVLAGTTIANVPATLAPGPRTLTGTFAAPATVVAGLVYALIIRGRAGQSAGIWANTDACPDGIWFYANLTGAFTASPGIDLEFATFVTA